MTASELIEGMKKLLMQFNTTNEVSIERVDVECHVEQTRTLDGKRKTDYNFHMTFAK